MIIQKTLEGVTVRTWESVPEAAQELGIPDTNIYKVLKSYRNSAGGYVWEKIDEEFSDKTSGSIEGTDNTLVKTTTTDNLVTTYEDAIKISNVDLTKWKVTKWIANYWGDKSQVKLFLERRTEQVLLDFYNNVEKSIKDWGTLKIQKTPGNKIGVLLTSDFHLGADVKNLLRTPNFSTDILINFLNEIAQQVNELNLSEVHFCFLGDFWESLSGMNHDSTFKSLETNMWGSNAVVTGHKIMSTFLSKINNLRSIKIITGNHDRLSPSKNLENTGEAGKLLAYLLSLTFPGMSIDCSDLVLPTKIDGINYILTHGDKGLANKDMSKVVFDYGDNNSFNLLVEGHWHSRKGKKADKHSYYKEYDFVSLDEQKYRKITLPAVFTGNYYSESIGYSGSGGFMVSINNGKGKPNILDITL